MAQKLVPVVDIADRSDGDLIAWDETAGEHVYVRNPSDLYDIERYTAGDIVVNDTAAGSDTDISVVGDLVVAAVAGDLLLIGLSARTEGAPSVSLRFDVATFVSGSPVNYVSSLSGTPSGQGISGFFMVAGGGTTGGGPIPYVVQSGDISGGNVTLSLRAWTTSASHTVAADADAPLVFWVRNMGQ